ncbi:MAG TPA: crossover junction endodeoxyribonuclease RuvC, partial [Chryseosolibacter sp.]|nr:crossover junction endodeoxyribonuclease RuvC [Chryseosolibacter sp.]
MPVTIIIERFLKFIKAAYLVTVGKAIKEKIILGLDPGTNIMGYGIICIKGSALTLVQYGVIHLSKYAG